MFHGLISGAMNNLYLWTIRYITKQIGIEVFSIIEYPRRQFHSEFMAEYLEITLIQQSLMGMDTDTVLILMVGRR